MNLANMEVVSHEAAAAGIHSFDLLVKDREGDIRVLVQSLIHTSDPGQYGVNKSDETVEIRKLVDQYNAAHPAKPVYLMGNVDGVGFSENPGGTIAKMLGVFDSFAQINTLFKISLYLQEIGLTQGVRQVMLDDDYFSPRAKDYFFHTYIRPAGARLISLPPEKAVRQVRAGRATLFY